MEQEIKQTNLISILNPRKALGDGFKIPTWTPLLPRRKTSGKKPVLVLLLECLKKIIPNKGLCLDIEGKLQARSSAIFVTI